MECHIPTRHGRGRNPLIEGRQLAAVMDGQTEQKHIGDLAMGDKGLSNNNCFG